MFPLSPAVEREQSICCSLYHTQSHRSNPSVVPFITRSRTGAIHLLFPLSHAVAQEQSICCSLYHTQSHRSNPSVVPFYHTQSHRGNHCARSCVESQKVYIFKRSGRISATFEPDIFFKNLLEVSVLLRFSLIDHRQTTDRQTDGYTEYDAISNSKPLPNINTYNGRNRRFRTTPRLPLKSHLIRFYRPMQRRLSIVQQTK